MPAQLPTGTSGLPSLGGRPFLFYRLTWWVLAAISCGMLAWQLVFPPAELAIGLLKAAKAAVLIAVSAILFRRRRQDPVAAMLGLAFLLWTISSSVDFAASSVPAAIIDRFRFLLFALALLLFPDGEWRPAWTRLVGVAIVITCLLGIAEAIGLLPTELFLPVAIGCVLASLAAMLVRYRALEPGAQKQQLKWVILGLVCGIALILAARAGAALTRDMIIPSIGAILLEGMFQLGIVVLALGFLTSLLRYRLYDAEAAISRSAVYAALTLTLVGTFAASESLIELLGQNFFGMAIGNISGAVAAAIAAMMLTPLHDRISGWAEQRFQHDLVALKQDLPDLLAVLSSSGSVTRLADAVLPRIGQAVHATRMALLVDGKLRAAEGISMASARRLLVGWRAPEIDDLHGRDDDASFPLHIGLRCPLGNIRAWLLLGLRPDGSFYGRDDLEALAEIVPPLQRSLLAVAERETDELVRQRRERSIIKAIRAIEDRLDRLEHPVAEA